MELREQIAAEICVAIRDAVGVYASKESVTIEHCYDDADTILALLTKPTVTIPCGKCGGDGFTRHVHPLAHSNEIKTIPCTCTEGKATREIEWSYIIDRTGYTRTLTLTDLIDPDVAWTYSNVCNLKLRNVSSLATIPRGKGVLRVKGENDG